MITNNIYIKLLGTICLSIGLVVIVFLSSERQVHRNNAFTRRYPPHPVVKQYDLDIGFNSYYIAGLDKDMLYLGNRTSPWHLLQVNLETKDTSHIQLAPRSHTLEYRAIKVEVLPPYFFVMDGTMPIILRGKIGEWLADPWMREQAYFNKAIPIDSNTIYIRTTHATTHRSTLGLIQKKGEHIKVQLDTTLLQAQIDGVFDVDGLLAKDLSGTKLGYVYYYRNQFFTMDSILASLSRQRTIDTVQRAQLKIASKGNSGRTILAAPPLYVNRTAAMSKHLILVLSQRLGRNESKELLGQASIVDVYDHTKNTYEFSFYLYDIDKHKVREFTVGQNRIIALIEDHLSVYLMTDRYFNAVPSRETERQMP
ncbi:hypothetical protein [Flagellimonas halotolerans]|uniref:DUF4340 domain-containing protein n=1 Tax=Flagellimonas halotolerans TaxID=3112164 RepID=A0ABU6IRL6_9FLAO|nr:MULTISPECIES: hypothetical protein [unclassified Allomuricauda]MEC3965801.1 hypothetical protein [Muricauda sp. SYSU M86414]MEC4265733.1 hypothetical protein [Muricauda sp. SYSU M84420]